MVMRAAMITVVTIITIIIICSVCVLHAVVWTVSLAISAFFCSSLWLREGEPSSAPFINRVPNSSKCLITSVFAVSLHSPHIGSFISSTHLRILLHLTPFMLSIAQPVCLQLSLCLCLAVSLYISLCLYFYVLLVCLPAVCSSVYLNLS